MNGVWRGGAYRENVFPKDGRVSRRRSFTSLFLYSMYGDGGFRWGVKGVMRGASYRTILAAWRYRNGIRGYEWNRDQSRAYVGFRL